MNKRVWIALSAIVCGSVVLPYLLAGRVTAGGVGIALGAVTFVLTWRYVWEGRFECDD